MRGTRTDAHARQVLVHELTHALQDQHGLFDDEPDDDGDDESALAFAALVEGDATHVEQAWVRAQPPAVRRQLDDPVQGWDGGSGVLGLDVLDFPYVAGPRLVSALLVRDGPAALAGAYRDPPRTTAQVLHPGRGPGRRVAPPDPGPGQVVDRGVLGELGLASLVGHDPLDPYGPQRAWDGDAYVTVRDGGRVCTVVRVRADGVLGRNGLVDALREGPGSPEVSRSGRSGLVVRSCTGGPGAGTG